MITSIDFGSDSIRSARRSKQNPQQITLISERAEYVVLPAENDCREALANSTTPFAECEEAIVVFGNHTRDARW